MSKIRRIITPLREFIESEQIGGFILIFCVIISLIIANSTWSNAYHHLLSHEIGFKWNEYNFYNSIHFWINDVLMSIFFLRVGLEIKRELIEGELASFKRATFPILAAAGGMIIPAIIYVLFNQKTSTIQGWGIPMATDIAFALGILSLLGKRVPLSLKVFLAALAIVDDLGAILVIAIFYTEQLYINYVLYAGIILVILSFLNYAKVKSLWFYIPLGIILWYFTYKSGIHATIAGVLFAFTIPTNATRKISPLEFLEHALNKPVSFIIMPIFALSNTDITFNQEAFEGLISPAGLGIMMGLTLGKPIGITLLSWISVKSKLTKLPKNITWSHIIGAGFLGGIGFTMSIFISLLSFSNSVETQTIAKIAILLASVSAGIIGSIILRRQKKVEEKDVWLEVQTQ